MDHIKLSPLEYLNIHGDSNLTDYITYCEQYDINVENEKNKKQNENIQWFEQFVGKYVKIFDENEEYYLLIENNIYLEHDDFITSDGIIYDKESKYHYLCYMEEIGVYSFQLNCPNPDEFAKYNIEIISSNIYSELLDIIQKNHSVLKLHNYIYGETNS